MNRAIIAALMLGLASTAATAQQTRFYGPDGRSVGTATTSGNTTTFYGPDGRQAARRPRATLRRSTVPMAGGLAPQQHRANASKNALACLL